VRHVHGYTTKPSLEAVIQATHSLIHSLCAVLAKVEDTTQSAVPAATYAVRMAPNADPDEVAQRHGYGRSTCSY